MHQLRLFGLYFFKVGRDSLSRKYPQCTMLTLQTGTHVLSRILSMLLGADKVHALYEKETGVVLQ